MDATNVMIIVTAVIVNAFLLGISIYHCRRAIKTKMNNKMLEREIEIKQKVNESLNNEVNRLNMQIKKLKLDMTIHPALSDDVNRCKGL